MTETERRDELLDGAVAYVLRRGIADLSLRPLAAALGTSDRMLVYHFGSKAALVAALLERAADQLAVLLLGDDAPGGAGDPGINRDPGDGGDSGGAGDPSDPGDDGRAHPSLAERLRQLWERLSGPEAEPYVRLWFEVSGLAVRGHQPHLAMTARTAAAWLDVSTALQAGAGVPADEARQRATIEVAAVHGLLLDLLASGDRDRIDRAAVELFDRLAAWD